jgi:DNA-binding response OmpR family regulator
VLFMTGYGDGSAESDFLQTTAAVVLAKPLGIDALLERVRCLLTPGHGPPAAR